MKFISIKTKYIVGITCLILLVFFALFLYMRHEFSQRIEDELHKRGTSIARNIAIIAVKPIITENRIALQLFINESKRNEENIRYIYLVDRQGNLLAHTFGDSFPPALLKTDVRAMYENKKLIQAVYSGDERIADITDFIQQGDFGRIHVGLSEEGIKEELHQMMQHVVPVTVLIMLAGIIGAWLFAVQITRPITQLSIGTKKIGAGNFDIDITPATDHCGSKKSRGRTAFTGKETGA
jgi:sensor histidine kinase regulating citrate/malate metabolism